MLINLTNTKTTVQKHLGLFAVAVLISGCVTGPKVFVNENPEAQFSGFRTYAYAAELGTDRPGYSSLLSQALKAAVSRELNARGYREATSSPDLTVNFYVHTKEKIRTTTTTTPTAGFYYGYRRGLYDPWAGYGAVETDVRQYTEGTLTIDLVDARNSQLVWEGTAVGRVRDDMRENLQATIDAVVADVFARYSHAAQVQ